MTDQINHPADVEQPKAEALTVEQLTESIAKLEQNRDVLLAEKRAASSAKQELGVQLDQLQKSNDGLLSEFETFVSQSTVSSLLNKLNPVEGAEQLLSLKIQEHVKAQVVDGKPLVSLVGYDGEEINESDLIDYLQKTNANFCLAEHSSGGGATQTNYRSLGNAKADTQMKVGSQFGIGK